ncbi:Pro-rich N-terminal domain-containing protein [Streptomyces sp. CA-132043]|uniref:Pro-rich N-terminal domain-containing protein n=1 Tax=Streptomyces sp. CA-132043 TaxID=3240048 RepID=UPI003D89B7E6
MQHPGGAPLPPPHLPGSAGAWAEHQARSIPSGPQRPPAPAAPPRRRALPRARPLRRRARRPAPASAAGRSHRSAAPQQGAPAGWGGNRQAARPETATGHIQLPTGNPVALPTPPPGTAAPDVAHAAVAVLLIGPAGAGKTSVARHWADIRRVPTAHISLDDVREWVRAGFADPQQGWNDHSEAQYRLARRTCGFAARNFLANGISCILDDAVFPDRPVVGLGGWKRHVGPGLLPVVLLPGLEIVLERNAQRSGNRRLTDEEVARIHGRMAGWYSSGLPIIDNSQHDVATTARMLDEVVARSLASPPAW